MRILAIESSCDETGAAVLDDGKLISNVVQSQLIHSDFGGVVPEVASRIHIRAIVPVVRKALEEAGVGIEAIDFIAVTVGPGLIGSLIVGVAFAKALALAMKKPVMGVDHIESHIAANFLTYGRIDEPFICLVASGGHTHLFFVEGTSLELLGCTRDDAAGEAFDKVARMLGLGYPGGPLIEELASRGNPKAIEFPRPVKLKGYEFSFSGLKTAVRYYIDGIGREPSKQEAADIAASFQDAVLEILVDKTISAARERNLGSVSAVGGVASNTLLRQRLSHAAEKAHLKVLLPPPELCTDNAAIVAAAAHLKLAAGEKPSSDLIPYSTRAY